MSRLALFCLLSLAVACGKTTSTEDPTRRNDKDEITFEMSSTPHVTFVSRGGSPLAEAHVLIGYGENDPFEGNFLKTDASGQLSSPVEWTEPLPVTIEAPGYMRTTFYSQIPEGQVLQVNFKDIWDRLEIKGKTTDYTGVRKDKKIDFSLVLPSLRRKQFFFFDITDMVSADMDYLEAYGKHAIPSNMAFPNQKENYGIFPVRLNKPTYRLGVKEPGHYQLVAGHGKMPFKQTLSKIKNGASIFDLLNDVKFEEGATVDVTVGPTGGSVDIAVNQEKYIPNEDLRSPSFSQDLTMLGVALNFTGELYMPTDIKTFKANETKTLTTLQGRLNNYIFTVLGKTKQVANRVVTLTPQLSLVLGESHSQCYEPEFLPLIEKPRMTDRGLNFSPPAVPVGYAPVAMYTTLQEVKVVQTDQTYLEVKRKKWELFSDVWQEEMLIPDWPLGDRQEFTNRWEVMFLGQNESAPRQPIGPNLLETVTHATRNAVDF